eukprot:scaffold14710_cov98-Isochrysis_galbana.AAC.1
MRSAATGEDRPMPAHVRAGTQRPEMKDVACGWGGTIERFWDDPWPSRPFAKDPPHPSDMRQATPPPHHPVLSARAPPPRTPEETQERTKPRAVPPSGGRGHSPYDPAPP